MLNVFIPLLLVLPVAMGGAPPLHAAAVYTVLFVLVGTFGVAIPLLRDAEAGILRRVLLTGTSDFAFVLQRLLAATSLDAVQLLPALAVVLILGDASADVWIRSLGVLPAALLAANSIGLWVAAAARSIAEGALFGAVAALFLLHGSGVFRTPAPDSTGALIQAGLPFTPLHQAMLAAVGASREAGVPGDPWVPVVVLAGWMLVTLAFARVLLQRLATSPA